MTKMNEETNSCRDKNVTLGKVFFIGKFGQWNENE